MVFGKEGHGLAASVYSASAWLKTCRSRIHGSEAPKFRLTQHLVPKIGTGGPGVLSYLQRIDAIFTETLEKLFAIFNASDPIV